MVADMGRFTLTSLSRAYRGTPKAAGYVHQTLCPAWTHRRLRGAQLRNTRARLPAQPCAELVILLHSTSRSGDVGLVCVSRWR
jgi:hypothetical protein